MKRFKGNPILKPIKKHPWESEAVFNPTVLLINKQIHILYRAIGADGISRLGYASSLDGYHIKERLPFPVFEPLIYIEKDGCEDPRLTLLNKEIIMTYTALNKRMHQIVLTSIKVEDFTNKKWNWEERRVPFAGISNKNAVILPQKINNQYVMFHRIDPDIYIAYSHNLKYWNNLKAIINPRPRKWDSLKIGAAGSPIRINEGWLFIYHGVNYKKVYRLGVILLDKNDPEIILYRSEKPILEPTKDYELYGKVPNVVFSCGTILKDNQILIYYGGADSVVCVVTYDLNELLP